jgi:Tfp pilus assembly protein PilO
LARLSERKMAVIILALFGVALAGIAIISLLRYKEIRALESQIADVDKEISALKKRVDMIPALKNELSEVIGALEDMTQILPNKGDLQHDAFLRLLQTMAKDSQVEVRKLDVEVEKETKDKNFARFKYKVEFVGSYPQFVSFLYKIETDKRFLKIDSFRIPITKQTTSTPWLESPRKDMELTISTYTYTATPE